VRLRYLQDLDYRDMAHVLGVSENACRTRVHRALESLKKRFGAGAATMVAALPVPAPTHFDHLLHEVLQGAVQAAGKATMAVGWKVAGAAAVVTAVAVLAVPGKEAPSPVPGGRSRGPAVASKETSAGGVVRAVPVMPTGVAESKAPAPPTAAPPKTATAADAVNVLEEVASIGWDFGLRTSAAEVYGMILRIDPDHKVALARVGTDEENSTKAEDGRKSFDERLERASVEAAKILSDLGTAQAADGRGTDAQAMWRLALEVHDQDPLANERMKNRRLYGRWTSARRATYLQSAGAKGKTSIYSRSYRVRDTERSTGIPAKAGLSVMRMESENFLVEADLPARQITEFLEQLEAVRGSLRDLLELNDGRSAKPDGREFVLLSARDLYERAVDASDPGSPEAEEAAKRTSVFRRSPGRVLALLPDGMPPSQLLLHAAAHDLVTEAFKDVDPWAAEALVNIVTCPVLASGFRNCSTMSTGPDPGEAEPFLPGKAPAWLRSLVLRRRDMPLESLVALPADRLTLPGLVKAWSVLHFLLDTDRSATKGLLEDAAKEKSGKNANAERFLMRYFRDFKTWKDLDVAWRSWVLDVYRP